MIVANRQSMWIKDHHGSSSHADTWYKYAGDTEWRTVSITGTISSVNSITPTTQIPNVKSVVSLEIGSDVTSIGSYAFNSCTSLANVTIPGSVTSIGSSVFFDCNRLTSVMIGNGVISIGTSAFQFTAITELSFPNSVQIIGSNACIGCTNLSSVTIGSGIDSIYTGAFYQTKVTQIYIQKTIAETQAMSPSPSFWMYQPGSGVSGSVTITCTDGSFIVTWSDDIG